MLHIEYVVPEFEAKNAEKKLIPHGICLLLDILPQDKTKPSGTCQG